MDKGREALGPPGRGPFRALLRPASRGLAYARPEGILRHLSVPCCAVQMHAFLSRASGSESVMHVLHLTLGKGKARPGTPKVVKGAPELPQDPGINMNGFSWRIG